MEKRRAPYFIVGLASGVVMIFLFLLLKLMHTDYVLRTHLWNMPVMIAAVWIVLARFDKGEGRPRYLKGLGAGCMTAATGAILLAIFLVIYLSFIDPVYMNYVVRKGPLGEYMNQLVIALMIFTEQVAAGFIATLIIMQFYKTR